MNGQDLAKRAQADPQSFWADMAKRLDWVRMPTIIDNSSFHAPVSIKWYEDGILNVCYNCVDRHVPQNGQKTAIIWQGDAPEDVRHISFAALKDMVSQTANALLARGVKAGDRVTIYMPMVPEAAVAMLACARIGAIHSVVFGGFSAEALRDRITDCQSQIVITADEGVRGGKTIPLKTSVDTALEACPYVHTVLVLKRTGAGVPMQAPRDIWWHEIVDVQLKDCPCVPMNAEDPLFILYTSGSTGKPKGVLHTSGGYLVYASLTHEVSFGVQPGDIHWCTADVGWVTGHSYIVYGPLANATTTLMFEGVPHYPDWGRFWDVVDQHKVSIFYTAPTAIRALIREGDAYVKRAKRTSLRVLGSVGEPINRAAWEWYANVVGDGRCPVIDTYWQTETGGHIISPNPDTPALKAGAAMAPFAGVSAAIVDAEGRILEGVAEGGLVMTRAWPGLMRTVFGDHARFEQTYFSTYKGLYFTGDGARRDADGDYWITGRVDDVINVSGHRFGTAEIESAINRHPAVAESAVVGFPHDIKGQGIYAYVILKDGYAGEPALASAIKQQVRSIIGAIASLDHVHFTHGLPKTRSGKIMRRILRKIAAREYDTLGDTSTLADPAIVEALIKGRP